MAGIWKYREEALTFSVDYGSDLSTGDALSTGSGSVRVSRWVVGTGWVDRSTEFGSPAGTISGDTVQFQLSSGGAGHQSAGDYQVTVKADSDDGETFARPVELEVRSAGDPGTP